jgi:hypothetical protein
VPETGDEWATAFPSTLGQDGRVLGERGLGLVGLLVSLAVLGMLAGVSLLALGGGGTGPSVTLPGERGGADGSAVSSGSGGAVALAADEAAQANLRAALDALAQTAAVDGYGSVTVSGLEDSMRGVTFVNGPSTSASVISLTTGSAAGGAVSMAALAASGTCWLTWTTAATTSFGAEPKAATCVAPALAQPPAAGAPAPGHIGWQAGSFPAA